MADEWLTGREMLSYARRNGFPGLSDRTFEALRYKGLVPRPDRGPQQGRTPTWLYPPGAERQLVDALRWRDELDKDDDATLVRLWIAGYPAELAQVRTALARWIQTIRKTVDEHVRRTADRQAMEPGNRRDAIELAAADAAKRRGRNRLRLPHEPRMRPAERADAISALLGMFLDGASDATPEQEAAVERMLGVANGRTFRAAGTGPWLTGPSTVLADGASLASLPALEDAVATATDADFETCLPYVRIFVNQLPAVAAFLEAMYPGNRTGMGQLAVMGDHPGAAVLITAVLLRALRGPEASNAREIADTLEGLAPTMRQADEIADKPDAEFKRLLDRIPDATARNQVRRVRDMTRQRRTGNPSSDPSK